MPRQPRLDLAHIPHIVQRGNDRQPCFFADVDRVRYLQDLREISLREGCNVHAYVLNTSKANIRKCTLTPVFRPRFLVDLSDFRE